MEGFLGTLANAVRPPPLLLSSSAFRGGKGRRRLDSKKGVDKDRLRTGSGRAQDGLKAGRKAQAGRWNEHERLDELREPPQRPQMPGRDTAGIREKEATQRLGDLHRCVTGQVDGGGARSDKAYWARRRGNPQGNSCSNPSFRQVTVSCSVNTCTHTRVNCTLQVNYPVRQKILRILLSILHIFTRYVQ